MRSFIVPVLLSLGCFAQSLSVQSTGVIGTGCTPGRARAYHDDDRQRISVFTSDFGTEVGPSVPFSANRRNCRLTLGVDLPEGYTVEFDKISANVAYAAGRNVTLLMQAQVYWQGQITQSVGTTDVTGPAWSRNTTLTVDLEPADLSSPCGSSGVANIGLDLRSTRKDDCASGHIGGNVVWDVSYKLTKC
ncbi:hypothetical protein BKA70DRAFT_1307571 [Coprinopsis sp. MPI-PUGE-AT-0042]|nr:hypothetical protein BKA70DRAFT_1307571 [Coprinopsis sp. MPI-PUGE-AT-0042]